MINSYNIHNILRFQTEFSKKGILKGVDDPFIFFKCNETSDEHQVYLNVKDFKPTLNDCHLVDHKYYIRENYVFFSDSGPGYRYKVEVSGLDNPPVVINFQGKLSVLRNILTPNMLACEMILFPMLELSLFNRGYFLAHGCGLNIGGGGVLFLGRGGSFKTSILLTGVEKGYVPIGDDRVLIDLNNDVVYPFPLYPKIFEFLSRSHLRENYNLYNKMKLFSKLLNGEYDKDFWEHEPVPIKNIFLLKNTNNTDNKGISIINGEDSAKQMISNNMSEWFDSSISGVKKKFFEMLISYSYIYPDSDISNLFDINKSIELKFNNMKTQQIELNNKLTDFEELFQKISSN